MLILAQDGNAYNLKTDNITNLRIDSSPVVWKSGGGSAVPETFDVYADVVESDNFRKAIWLAKFLSYTEAREYIADLVKKLNG